MYDRLKALYSSGQLTLEGLEKAVAKGWITEEQKQSIVDGGVEEPPAE